MALDELKQGVLNDIISIMTGSSLTETFFTDVLLRLEIPWLYNQDK